MRLLLLFGVSLKVIVAALCWCCPARALSGEQPLSQLRHTSWATRDEFNLPPVTAFAQTEDGYLWIGTKRGLWRFDGARFTAWKQPSSGETALASEEIWSLSGITGGGLWIGTASGISRLADEGLTSYPHPQAGVRSILAGAAPQAWGVSAGQIWNLTSSGASLPEERMPSGSRITALYQDRTGRFWAGTESGVCRWQTTESQCYPTSPYGYVHSIAEDAAGQLVVAAGSSATLLRLIDGKFTVVSTQPLGQPLSAPVLLADRDRNLWIGTTGQGLVRLGEKGLERYTPRDGLSGSNVQALFEDRGGNLWVATRKGIDRLSEPRVSHVTSADGLSDDVVLTLCNGRYGAVWAGTNYGLNLVQHNTVAHFGVREGLPNASILAVFEDRSGQIWVATRAGLAVGKNGRFRPIPGSASFDHVTTITADGQGRIWVADSRQGLAELVGNRLRPFRSANTRMPQAVHSLTSDQAGRLWIGYAHGGLAIQGSDTYDPPLFAAGSDPDGLLTLYADANRAIWVGSNTGLRRYRNSRWTEWTGDLGAPPGGVQSIVEDRRGGLWLNTDQALLRCDAADLAAQPDGAPGPLRCARYGASEGVRPETGSVQTQSRSVRTHDGRLWFATSEGIAVVDPARLGLDRRPPLVSIQQVRADGRTITLRGGTGGHVLSVRAREWQFDFGAPGLTAAENIRFRYQLVNRDSAWVEAGTHRQAFYTDLPPGQYTFRILACNEEGIWSEEPVDLVFQALPAFYRGWWFYLGCFAASLAAVWSYYRWNIARMTEQFNVRLGERLAERNRIARELHDTLLQSVVGVSLQIGVITKRAAQGSDPQKRDLERVRRQLDEALREARQSVWELRSSAQETRDLPSALTELGNRCTAGRAIRFRLNVSGTVRSCADEIQQQLLLIAQEAVRNSTRHSKCSQIEAELRYGARELRLTIGDNGVGFTPRTLAFEERGHFGLKGMRERAASIGAESTLCSRPGQGTSLVVVVPTERRRQKQSLAPRARRSVQATKKALRQRPPSPAGWDRLADVTSKMLFLSLPSALLRYTRRRV